MKKKVIGPSGGGTSLESSHKSHIPRKRFFKVAILILVLLILSGIAGIAWLYVPPVTKTKNQIFQIFNLPLARVDLGIISSKNVIEYQELMNGLGKSMDFKESLNLLLKQERVAAVHDKLIGQDETEFARLLKEKLLNEDDEGLDSKYKNRLLNNYSDTEELKLLFVQNENVNKQYYAEAKQLLEKLESGVEFGEAAKLVGIWKTGDSDSIYSGDVGYIPFDQISPELQIGLKDAKVSSNKIVPTRTGLAVVQFYDQINTDDNQKALGLRVLVIPVPGFEKWLDDKLRTVQGKVYIKL